MNQSPQTNRHILGVSALIVAILGLGIAASIRPTEHVSSITTAQTAQLEKWANPATLPWADPSSSNFAPALSQIPSNAYGSAQPTEPVRSDALTENRAAMSQPTDSNAVTKVAGPADSRKWTDKEWEIASKAVAAYRMVGKAAQALVPNSNSDAIWQPPEEIANGNGSGETR